MHLKNDLVSIYVYTALTLLVSLLSVSLFVLLNHVSYY